MRTRRGFVPMLQALPCRITPGDISLTALMNMVPAPDLNAPVGRDIGPSGLDNDPTNPNYPPYVPIRSFAPRPTYDNLPVPVVSPDAAWADS